MLTISRQDACWEIFRRTVREEPFDVFALLDGARVRCLPGEFEEHDAEHACLLAGEEDPAALTRAPYLARVPAASSLARWLAEEGWGRSWGIYALCPRGTDLDIVLRDVREAMQARLPDGRIVGFRFFDPRVWRVFFPTCDALQLRVLFGRAVRAFACEDTEGNTLLLDTVDDSRPSRAVHHLPS